MWVKIHSRFVWHQSCSVIENVSCWFYLKLTARHVCCDFKSPTKGQDMWYNTQRENHRVQKNKTHANPIQQVTPVRPTSDLFLQFLNGNENRREWVAGWHTVGVQSNEMNVEKSWGEWVHVEKFFSLQISSHCCLGQTTVSFVIYDCVLLTSIWLIKQVLLLGMT